MGLILVKIDNIFVLKETSSYGGATYRIDGKDILDFKDVNRYQFDHVPRVESIQHRREIDYYEKDGNKLSHEEYLSKVRELRDSHVDEDGDWDSIDAEFTYRKWAEGWSPTFKEYDEYTILEIPSVTQRKSEYKEIHPMWQIGLIEDPLCQYVPNFVAYIRECAKELGLEEKEVGYWAGNDVQNDLKLYVRLSTDKNSIYDISIGKVKLPKEGRQTKGTYDECVVRRTEDVQHIRNIMQRAYDEQKATLTQDKAKDVIAGLRRLLSDLNSLDVYKKSVEQKRFMKKRTEDMINMIIVSSGDKK